MWRVASRLTGVLSRGGLMGVSAGRRVVVTGVGAVTPLGNDVRSSWEALLEGKSAAAPITAFDTSGHTVRFACEVKGFEPSEWMERRQARRMDRFGQLVVAAAVQAVADSDLEVAEEPDRVGVSVGTGMGGLDSFGGSATRLLSVGGSGSTRSRSRR